jgi:hypothetical protein
MLLVAFEGGLHGQKRKRRVIPRNGYAVPLGTRIECLNYVLECSKGHGLGLNIPI